MTALTKPLPLDNTRLHHPDVVRKHKADTADFFQAIKAAEQAKVAAAQAAIDYSNRALNEAEYWQISVDRKAAQDAIAAERKSNEKAAALVEIDRLMQSPPIAEVMHRSEYSFIQEVIMWANRGYVMNESGFINFGMGHYHVLLTAPAAPIKRVSK